MEPPSSTASVENSVSPASSTPLPERAIELAALILSVAEKSQTPGEKYQAWKMARMMTDPQGKAMTLALTDQVFRPASAARSAEQMRSLIAEYGVPAYLPLHERMGMAMGGLASRIAPALVMKAVTAKMRAESSRVILPSEDRKLTPHLEKRRRENSRMNINQLGEAILGEEEAARRLDQVIARIENPRCEYVSVKISAIFSQIHLIAYEQTLDEIKTRLRRLYRAAMANPMTRPDGSVSPKFVNLDMEEYRDLRLTVDAFVQTLGEPEFQKLSAGIVLQAYLPDSFSVQKELTEWAKSRVAAGGAPIKIRIVKGANLAMEKVDASLHGWPLATYNNKRDVDANYKRMLHYGCQPENARAAKLGVASHNLFEISAALLTRADHGVENFVEFEMLEGMANHQARAVKERAGGLLFYAPVVKREDFHSAISYLVRRLDENTHEENFLHDIFGMTPGGEKWEKQKRFFLDACAAMETAADTPSRTQNRATETHVPMEAGTFENCPDTDWSLTQNQKWIASLVEEIKGRDFSTIPLVINGQEITTETTAEGIDPSLSRPTHRYSLATEEHVRTALDSARRAQSAWAARGAEERGAILRSVAVELAKGRGEAIGTMTREAGKAPAEGDAEVSEAIDFANYYACGLSWGGLQDGVVSRPLGVVTITPPWNFPFAIPCGGILAPLMAGNAVILKPAPQTVLTAWNMVNLLWAGGVPKDVLQFVPCPDNEIGRLLVTESDAVVLTGAYETGRMFQNWKPDLRLFAETSGKNSLIITNAADPDLAIKDLIKSAFGHAGQKCSAASLAILEADLYDNPAFMRQLKDAASSLHTGQSWDLSSIVTPVMNEPEANLRRALTTLDAGETWLLEPRMLENNPRLWTPGIKLGVRPGSWFHKNECFGPVLGLIRAESLADAIAIQNDSAFGLTGGIHSLDKREIALWRESVEVGNAYINRPITGAIVRRQPFGGWKNSCFGPGAKAGGPNYVSLFASWEETDLPALGADPVVTVSTVTRALSAALPSHEAALATTAASQARWMREEFLVEHDPSALHGETNHFRYVPLPRVLIRADDLSDRELAILILASASTQVPIEISLTNKELHPWLRQVKTALQITTESEAALIGRLPAIRSAIGCLRAPNASEDILRAANDTALRTITARPLANGRLELLNWHREQAISECVHRYGNIIPPGSAFAD